MEINNRGIVKNGFISGIQTVVQSFAYLAIYYLLIHKVGKAQVGMWSSISAIPMALSAVGSGVSGCLVRYIPIYIAEKNYTAVRKIIVNGLIFNLAVVSLFCFTGVVFAEPFLHYYFSLKGGVPEVYRVVYYCSLIAFFITFLQSVLLFSLDGLQLIYQKNVVLIASTIVYCLVATVLISFYGIKGLVYAQIFQAVLVLLLTFRLLRKSGAFSHGTSWYSREHQRLFFSYGKGLQAISLSIIFFDPITRFFLLRYYNLDLVAMYDMASRAIIQGRTLIVSALQVITPDVSKKNREQRLDVPRLFAKAVRGSAMLTFLGFSTIIVLAVTLITYAGDQRNFSLYMIFLSLLSVAYFANIIAAVPYNIMMGLGKLRPVIISHLFSTGLNLVLFCILAIKPLPSLLLLPTSIAVGASSVYLMFIFLKNNKGIHFNIPGEDKYIYFVSVMAIIVSITLYYVDGRLLPLLAFNVLYLALVTWLIFKNQFLSAIREKVLLRTTSPAKPATGQGE